MLFSVFISVLCSSDLPLSPDFRARAPRRLSSHHGLRHRVLERLLDSRRAVAGADFHRLFRVEETEPGPVGSRSCKAVLTLAEAEANAERIASPRSCRPSRQADMRQMKPPIRDRRGTRHRQAE